MLVGHVSDVLAGGFDCSVASVISAPIVTRLGNSGRRPEPTEVGFETDIVRRYARHLGIGHVLPHLHAGSLESHDSFGSQITSRPRSRDAKVTFYSNLTRALQARCDVLPSDVMVSLHCSVVWRGSAFFST
ncbi:tautomerase family protein [Rhizobium sp. Root1203]|uniref:tautomerase family protein n=1 Tax=Rhizobium sp. Root1203 TaxID=1736427 RepID=UPI001FCCEE7A|nr:tautomerase family protein [Rhizobium sp. Root1203]